MTIEEYNKVRNLTYDQYLTYLKDKHGRVPFKYGTRKNNVYKPGLFIHHDKEDTISSLSSGDNKKQYPEYQVPEYLTYCTYLEHLLLHIMIGREADPEKHLGLNGPCRYIIPALLNYYNEGFTNPGWNEAYYTCLKGNKEVFDLLLAEYNSLVKDIDVVMSENKTLYLQAENLLDTVDKALIVLGTGEVDEGKRVINYTLETVIALQLVKEI